MLSLVMRLFSRDYIKTEIDYLNVGLGNILVLSFIVILKCHDNRYQKDFSVSYISPAQYNRSLHDYFKDCSYKFYASA